MNSQPLEETPLPAARPWKPCSHCHTSNPPWASDCMQCRQSFPDALESAVAETTHIEYVLQQLPDWRRRGLLSDSSHARLRSDYLHLQQQIADSILQQRSGSSAPNHAVVTPVQSVTSAADNPKSPSDARSAQPFWPMDLSGFAPTPLATTAPGATTPQTPPFVPPSAPPRPQAGDGLRRFFQKHALQVLFTLATVLVLAALRTMLGWTWIGDVAMRLLPVVPLGLTAMFWTFGQKTRAENAWAAFAYHSLAAALSAFDVFALNKYWLPTPLTGKPVLLLAALTTLCVAGALFRRWRDIAYLHLFQAAAVTTLFAVVQMLRLDKPPGDFRLTPLWLFGVAYLAYAAFCLVMAQQSDWLGAEPSEEIDPDADSNTTSVVQQTRSSQPTSEQADATAAQNPPPVVSAAMPAPPVPTLSSPAIGQAWRMAWTFWAHFSVVGVVFLAAVNVAWEHPSLNDFALLSLLTGLIYVGGAQLLLDARMARVSCVFLIGGGLLWLDGHHRTQLWEGACAFPLTLSALALVLARYNRQRADGRGAGEQLAKAYLATGRWNVWFAAVLSCLYVMYAFGAFGEQSYHVQGITGSVLMLACGAFYLIFARLEEKPALLYAAFVAWAVGLAALLLALAAPRGLYPLVLTLYGVALALIADRQSRRSDARPAEGMAAEGTSGAEMDWVAPQRNSGIALATGGALMAAGLPFWDTLAASWQWSTATLTLGFLLYIGQARKTGAAGYAYAALLCAAWISALLTWRVLVPQPFRLADSLAAFTLATAATSLVLARRNRVSSSDSPNRERLLWEGCITQAALVAALLCLRDGVYVFCIQSEVPHYAYSLFPCLVASLLLCGARFVGNRDANDALRRGALACAGIAAGVEVGLLCHAWQGVDGRWQPTALRAWGIGLVALGCGWRLAARLSRKWNGQEWWQHELMLAALTTAFLGLLPLTWAAENQHNGGAILLFETAFAATFALFALEADRTRQTVLVVFGQAVVALAAVANRAFAPDGITLALAVYGCAWILPVWRCRDKAFVAAASWTLATAYIHHLLSLTEWYAHSQVHSPALSWPHFAFYVAQASLLWLLIGWQMERRLARNDLAQPLLACAGSLAMAGGVVALLTVHTPGEGKWSILTLGWAGVVWFLLWALEQGEICLHVAAGNLILAWSLILYDRLGANPAFLDLYLLPVGLHLLTIGHLHSRRQQQRQARSLWTLALLLTITPAFLAFWNHDGDLHTLLFVGECLLSALWGIWQRIRAFVLIGTGYIALYAGAVVVGHLPEVWGTLVTLVVGVTLFIMGFYILTHRVVMQQWVGVFERKWEAWRAWR